MLAPPQGSSLILFFSSLYLYNNNFSFILYMNMISLFHLRSTSSISIRLLLFNAVLLPTASIKCSSKSNSSPIDVEKSKINDQPRFKSRTFWSPCARVTSRPQRPPILQVFHTMTFLNVVCCTCFHNVIIF